MSDEKDKEPRPVFWRPKEQQPTRDDDPYAEQRAYFAYWELRRQQRVIEERENSTGLSVYEQARRKQQNSF